MICGIVGEADRLTDRIHTLTIFIMKRIVALLGGLILSGSFLAQASAAPCEGKKDSIEIGGRVYNNFTQEGIKDVRLAIYREDGSLYVDSVALEYFGFSDGGKGWTQFSFIVPRQNARYRFHAESKGYKPLDYWYEVKVVGRRRIFPAAVLAMQRDFESSPLREQQLGEAVVKATKVQVYYKGDTIVYNASAFQLADGSMLDDLVRQLPGAEMRENGEIFINGRKVDYLKLNGKDSFRGNNRIMLDNLPYYTVDQLKVYEESTERSKALGHDVDKKDYVMDVRLKKEYSTGYMGNAQAAGGTDDRYLARLFGLRFTDQSRISLFGASNNINESRKPGADTDWRPESGTVGTEHTHQAGVDVSVEDKDRRWKEAGNVVVSWVKRRNESRTSRETFLNDGSVFDRGWNDNTHKNLAAKLFNEFTLLKPFFLKFRSNLRYNRTDRLGASLGQSFNAHPDSLGSDTVNASTNRWTGDGWNVTAEQSLNFTRNLIWGDDIEANAYVRYNKSVTDDFSRYGVRYADRPAADEQRHRYDDTGSRGYEYGAKLLYRLVFDKVKWEWSYQYRQSQTLEHQSRYRLEQLAEWNPDLPLEWLPSTASLLRQAMDNENSRSTDYRVQGHDFSTKFTIEFVKDHNLEVSYTNTWQNERYHFSHSSLDTLMHRRHGVHNVKSSYWFGSNHERGWANNYRFHYIYRQEAPEMAQLVPVRNTYNPLAIVEGNPDLKNFISHDVGVNINCNKLKGDYAYIYVGAGFATYKNNIATSTLYDAPTGVYTYRPVNVNGNNKFYGGNSYSQNLFNRRLQFGHSFYYTFRHNVDLMQSQRPGELALSKVNTHDISEQVNASYSFGDLTLGASVEIKHQRATSSRVDFEEIRANDWTYGLTMQWKMPWELHLATDLKMFTRRGYGDASMNTDDLVWNASLSRSFCKGRLTTTLQGYDLLHQLSNVTYVINGQGRTETWNRSIPSYFMFHLQWKFNKNPKKKS